jgi:hypothetical protein
MITVTHVIPGCPIVAVIPFPADIDAWRKLLGGPIDLGDCARTACPVAVVTLFQNARIVSGGAVNEIAAALLDEPVFGPAVLVTGASAVDLLDEQFNDWQGDEDEVREAGAR